MIDKEKLKMLPKYEEYMVYVNKMIISSPKCCRISIGDELKKTMYNSLYQIYRLMYLEDKYRLNICNELDALFLYQRSVIRTMYDLRYIDIKKKMNNFYGILKIKQISYIIFDYYNKCKLSYKIICIEIIISCNEKLIDNIYSNLRKNELIFVYGKVVNQDNITVIADKIEMLEKNNFF